MILLEIHVQRFGHVHLELDADLYAASDGSAASHPWPDWNLDSDENQPEFSCSFSFELGFTWRDRANPLAISYSDLDSDLVLLGLHSRRVCRKSALLT